MFGKKHPSLSAVMGVASAVWLLAACASTAPASPDAAGRGLGGTASAGPARGVTPGSGTGPTATTGSTAGSTAASAAGTAGTTPPSPSATDGARACGQNGIAVTARADVQPAPVCLPPGGTFTVTTQPSAAQPWQDFTSSDPSVLACTSRPLDQGARAATCHALRQGSVTVSTATAPFQGDPHGPAQRIWSLTVHVQAGR